jgi:hypothetical protein
MGCLHCRMDKKIRCLGLCYRCYDKKEIRVLYGGHQPWNEPTQEEVDQCVFEQMQCLPKWWLRDWEKPDGEDNTVRVEPGRVVGEAVKRGRGLRVRGG